MASPILEQRADPGKWKAVTLTVLMHLLLVAALFFGVRWSNRGPESVEVEVWRAPPAAAPAPEAVRPPPEPPKPVEPPPKKVEPPPPPKPDIAVKPDKPEPKKPEPPKTEAPLRPLHNDAVARELEQVARNRTAIEEQLKAEQAAQDAARAKADAAAAAAASARARGLADYVSSIKGKIRGNVVLPPAIAGNPEAIFEVVQLPTGEVLNVKLKKSSGNAALDDAIERAILKSSPLPKPKQPELFQRVLELKYRPVEE